MVELARVRAQYADRVMQAAGVKDERVAAAFAAVPRERFLGPGPWLIAGPSRGVSEGLRPSADDDPARVYVDTLVALAPERRINNGKPSLHAACLHDLGVRPGAHVVHVGCGTGYYTALLAELAGPEGRVAAYEVEADLAARAAAALADRANVTVHAHAFPGRAHADVDALYANAGVTRPPKSWIDALVVGGRALMPLTGRGGQGCMLLVERRAAGLAAELGLPVVFVGAAGERDAEEAAALTRAFMRQDPGRVRGLAFDDAAGPDDWVAGHGWRLSTAAPDAPDASRGRTARPGRP